jgi:hypothetical protein
MDSVVSSESALRMVIQGVFAELIAFSSGVAMALVFRNAEWCQNVGMGRAR